MVSLEYMVCKAPCCVRDNNSIMGHAVFIAQINTINMNCTVINTYLKNREICMNYSSVALISTHFTTCGFKLALNIFLTHK